MLQKNGLYYDDNYHNSPPLEWQLPLDAVAFDEVGIRAILQDLEQPCYVVRTQGQIGVTQLGQVSSTEREQLERMEAVIMTPPFPISCLGAPEFLASHKVKSAYMTGAMANGIASEALVIAMGKNQMLASFGAAGLPPKEVEAAIHRIQQALPQGPYAFNLIHSPSEPLLERRAIELYLKYGVSTVEASAFMDLTLNIIYYRAAGLSLNTANEIEIKNKIIAKISRPEVARKFLQPAPVEMLQELVEHGLITELQAKLAQKVPMADDITAEGDSGGHTDNRPLVCLLPSMIALRDEVQQQYGYTQLVRVGAAGGIGTPKAAMAAFVMGADYVVTGSVNQSCIESGASEHTRNLLAQAEMTDVMMAPAADMFEMGVKLQVLKRGTLFPTRAQKLFELYRNYNALEEIPVSEREKLEKQIFRRSLDTVWEDTVAYFIGRDPEQIERANNNPKRRMALVFRWYLGLSSRWSNNGQKDREIDYQIWCGPSMGAFNEWVRGSYLEDPQNRTVTEVARHIMMGTALLCRLQNLQLQGLFIPSIYSYYHPLPQVIPTVQLLEVH